MASWMDSFNPFKNNANFDTNFNDAFDTSAQVLPGNAAPGSDWFDMMRDAKGNQLDANADAYHKRIGEYLANHLGAAGYYTDGLSQQNLGANVASLVNLARAKAAASGNPTATNDTTREYLKNYLKQYLTTGNMAGAVGIGGPGSTGTSYKDLYGQVAANAKAASDNAANNKELANFYSSNSGNILSGLQTAVDLQTGGGLRSAVSGTVRDLGSKADFNNGQFWQGADGGVYNPWGGSFSSNLQQPTPTGGGVVVPAPSPGGGTGETLPVEPPGQTGPIPGTDPMPLGNGQNPYSGTPQAPAPLPYSWNGPGEQPQYQPVQPQPVAVPGSPGMTTVTTGISQDPMSQLTNQLTTVWSRLFGRAPTYNEVMQWQGRLSDRYGGNFDAMVGDLENSAPAQQYRATGRAAPVVANGQDRGGAQSYWEWLKPEQDASTWIDNYLAQYSVGR